jgi:hypothetical protein
MESTNTVLLHEKRSYAPAENKSVWFSKIYTICILLLPVLNEYKLGAIDAAFLGEAIYICFIVFSFFCKPLNKKFTFDNSFIWIFLLYTAVFSPITLFFQGSCDTASIIGKFGRLIIYFGGFLLWGQYYFDIPFAIRAYKLLAVVFSFFLIFQSLVYTITGQLIVGILFKNMTINMGESYTYAQYIAYLKHVGFRPTSFFTEPSHFCQYSMIPLILSLFPFNNTDSKDKTDYFTAIIISAAGLFSYSTSALIFIALIWLLWLFFYIPKKSFAKMIIGLIALVITVFILQQKTNIFQKFVERFSTITYDYGTTGTQRLLRGLYIWNAEGTYNKIIGVGLGNVSEYLIANNIRTIFDTGLLLGNEYMNAFSYVLVFSGVVGFILYCLALYKYFIAANRTQKIIFLIFIILNASACIFVNATYMLYMLFITYKFKAERDSKVNSIYAKI